MDDQTPTPSIQTLKRMGNDVKENVEINNSQYGT
jgi:hypothetical protein